MLKKKISKKNPIFVFIKKKQVNLSQSTKLLMQVMHIIKFNNFFDFIDFFYLIYIYIYEKKAHVIFFNEIFFLKKIMIDTRG
jgi:hypothetical protein